MTMLKKATNRMSYAKVGLYGTAGSGKTRTAAEIAIGIVQYSKNPKPVGMFDTEPAASFIIPLFEKVGIEFMVYDESRAFADLMRFTNEAKDACSVIIVDSITHIWRDIQESYLARTNEFRRRDNKRALASLEFQHWGPIKREWAEFTDLFLSSKVHMIVCGRAGNVYEYQEKDDGSGKKELITTGTKMATEKELGYEPSLLIEMEIQREDGAIINTAVIQKDRADRLNGREIPFPTFEKLKPHFEALNIGGEHFDSMNKRDSREMFNEAGEDNFGAELRRKEIALEEIKEELLRHHGHGMDVATKSAKAETLEKVSGTRAWAKLESMRLPDIHRARNTLWLLTRGHDYGFQLPIDPPKAEVIDEGDKIPFDTPAANGIEAVGVQAHVAVGNSIESNAAPSAADVSIKSEAA